MVPIASKKNRYCFSIFFLYIFIISFSCVPNQKISDKKKIKNNIFSSQKIRDKKSNSNFLAYYNSYYLAKVKFQNAFDLMNKETSNNRQSENLFDDAIKYALIVINDFKNTDYFEDAAYIIARSSYYKNLLSPSTFYFKEILKNKNSPYYFDSLVRLGFINIALDNKEQLLRILHELEYQISDFNKNVDYLKKKIPYKFLENELLNTKSNYFILKAETSKYLEEPDSVIEEHYLESIEYATTNNHKKDIYIKLINLFELTDDQSKILYYINKIKDDFDIEDDTDYLMSNWYSYNRKLGFFQDIHEYLDNELSNDISNEQKIYYSIEKAKTYIEQSKFVEADNILSSLLIEYEENMNSYKKYFSEIYFHLGQLYMEQFEDYDKALTYFSLSLEKIPTDTVVKDKFQSLEKYVEKFNQYLLLTSNNDTASVVIDEINANSFMVPLPSDYKYESSSVDSLLFDMSSILYFDLGLIDQALNKLNLILDDDLESPLMPKVILMLKQIKPSSNWDSLYSSDLTLYDNKEQSFTYYRNNAFSEMDKSIDNALKLFENNYNDYNDLTSLYMAGFIYDEYLNDMVNAVKCYSEYISYSSEKYFLEASSRLNEIKSNLESEINLLEHKKSYYNAMLYLNNNQLSDVDSIIVELEKYKQSSGVAIRKKSEELLKILQFPSDVELKDSLTANKKYHVFNNSRSKETMESLIFNIADFIHRKTNNNSLAANYYKIIYDYYKDSEFYTEALLALNQIDPNNNWLSLLSDKKNEDFLNIEKFNPRTGAQVIEATRKRLFPEDFKSNNMIYYIPFDSLPPVLYNLDNPNSSYNIIMKHNFLSYDLSNNAKMAILDDDNEIRYFLSDEKIFFNNNSVVAINPEYNKSIEIPFGGYAFNSDFSLVAYEIFESVFDVGYRYNIDNSESICEYMGEDLTCYEIDFIPSDDANPKRVWILEIEDNVFLKIREHEFDGFGNLLFERNMEYKKYDIYHIIDKIEIIDFDNTMLTVLKRNDLEVDNGKMNIQRYPDMKDQSLASHNNFFYIKSLFIDNNDIDKLNDELNHLNSIYELLFPENHDEVLIEEQIFDYVQSINQYFYFVEDASIGGVELTNDDWLVSYNNDIIVGARKYAVGGNIDIPIMGYDNSSENTKISTEGYCKNGDLPIIKVHKVDGQIIDMDVIKVDGDLEFKSIGHATIILKKD